MSAAVEKLLERNERARQRRAMGVRSVDLPLVPQGQPCPCPTCVYARGMLRRFWTTTATRAVEVRR